MSISIEKQKKQKKKKKQTWSSIVEKTATDKPIEEADNT